MFIVFNKQKIYSYLVALSTVVILFVIAFAVTSQPSKVIQTSTNQVQASENQIQNSTNQIQPSENKINVKNTQK